MTNLRPSAFDPKPTFKPGPGSKTMGKSSGAVRPGGIDFPIRFMTGQLLVIDGGVSIGW